MGGQGPGYNATSNDQDRGDVWPTAATNLWQLPGYGAPPYSTWGDKCGSGEPDTVSGLRQKLERAERLGVHFLPRHNEHLRERHFLACEGVERPATPCWNTSALWRRNEPRRSACCLQCDSPW